MLPTFLIIGAEKSATTWLYARLREHPDVFLPGTKEAHFFNKYDSNLEERDNFTRLGRAWYERLFRGYAGETAVGEATPMYLCDPAAPSRIRRVLPEAKLICSLRNPVDRAYAHYWMAKRKGHTRRGFEEVFREKGERFVQRGLYGRQLARYLDLFPKEQLLILIQEELIERPEEHLRCICDFIGVDGGYYTGRDLLSKRENRAAEYRSRTAYEWMGRIARSMRSMKGLDALLDLIKGIGLTDKLKKLNRVKTPYPDIPGDLRRELVDYYAEDVRRLEGLLGRRIAAWRPPFKPVSVEHTGSRMYE